MQDNTPTSPDSKRRSPSAVPYAVLVPVLALLAHSAWMVQRGARMSIGALVFVFVDPLALFGMIAIVLVAFSVISPFVSHAASRWVVFLLCIVGLTLALKLLFPELPAE